MKSRRKNKLSLALTVVILALALFIAVPISGFCYAAENGANTAPDNEAAESVEITDGAVANEDEDVKNESPEGSDTREDNVFALAYEYLSAHTSEIFSALAFAASVILMLSYKKGFLPLIKSGMNAICGGVESLGQKAKSIGGSAEELYAELSERTAHFEEILAKMNTALDTLSAEFSDAKKRDASIETLKVVLKSEIDMMYEIFMAAALPQYLKERVGEEVAKMHRAVDESESGNEA